MPSGSTIFDVETNWLHPGHYAVLSFCALYVQTWLMNGHRHFKVYEEFDRLYYPQEPYNCYAIMVNALSKDVITQKCGRSGDEYPLQFNQDQDVSAFCRQSDLAVCHKTPFETKLLKQAQGYEFPANFCTMRTFSCYCAISHHHTGSNGPSWKRWSKSSATDMISYSTTSWPTAAQCLQY